jgi:hypothetical protein
MTRLTQLLLPALLYGATPTSITVTNSKNPATLGRAITLTATVTPSAATGTLTFYHGTTAMGSATLTNGTATLTVSTLPEGSHPLTATYGGNATNAPSTSPIVNQVVN